MPANPYYTLGLDLGQTADPTALAIVESDPSTSVLRLVGLKRFPLRTPYTEILRVLEGRLNSGPLAGRVRLAVDATGIGAPFVDQFRDQLPALSLALWLTKNQRIRNRNQPAVWVDRGDIPGIVEMGEGLEGLGY